MFMNRLTDSQLTQVATGSALAAVIVGILAYIDGSSNGALLAPLLAIPAGLSLIEKNDRRARALWTSNVRAVFDRLDHLQDGRRWKGVDSELVHMDDPQPLDDTARQLRVCMICKTNRGAWFALDIITQGAHVCESAFREIDQEEAGVHLLHNEKLYVKHFGTAEIA